MHRQLLIRPLAALAATLVAAAGCSDQAQNPSFVSPQGGPVLAVAGSDLTSLGTLGGATSVAYDINASGVVVGTSTLADGSSRAFRWTPAGGMAALPAGTIVARGVNGAGQVTGRGVFGTATRAFVWTPGGETGTLKQLPLGTAGASAGEGRDVNSAGQVAGFVTVSGKPKPVLWTPDASAPGGYRVTQLGDFGGGQGEALAINAHGTVVGWSTDADGDRVPFRWTPGAPNGSSGSFARLVADLGEATDINDAGQIAGWILVEGGQTPARWDPGVIRPILMTDDVGGSLPTRGMGRGISEDGRRMAGVRGTQARAFAFNSPGIVLEAPSGSSAAHRISLDGETIVGMEGGVAAVWVNVVTNAAPVASVGGTYHVVGVGDTIVMDGRHSTDPDGDPLTFAWLDLRGDTIATGPTFRFTYDVPSGWGFYLVATDDDGVSNRVWFVIYVNSAPVADIAGGDTVRLAEGEVFRFDGNGSYDPDRHPITHHWDMGDGTAFQQPAVNKSYQDNGTYTARLIVRDSVPNTGPEGNRADTLQVAVIVGNIQPTATFPDGAGLEGRTRVLALTGAMDPSVVDRASLRYGFDCGTGTFSPFSSDSTYICAAWPDQDTVAVRARIQDKDGGLSVYTRRQYIANVLPGVTASASATTVRVGDLVTLAPGSAFTDSGDDAPWTWFYEWGDGVVTRGETRVHDLPPSAHRYTAPGTYTLRVKVRDDRGFGHAAPITITVNP